MYATLIHCPPAGLACNRQGCTVAAHPFVGQKGKVVEFEDTGYDAEYPTGYEPCYYLVDFGTESLWLPAKMYVGDDANGKEVWETFLKFD